MRHDAILPTWPSIAQRRIRLRRSAIFQPAGLPFDVGRGYAAVIEGISRRVGLFERYVFGGAFKFRYVAGDAENHFGDCFRGRVAYLEASAVNSRNCFSVGILVKAARD